MTTNDHVNAIYSSVNNMSEKDLVELEKTLSMVLSTVQNRIHDMKHARLHHPTPAERK